MPATRPWLGLPMLLAHVMYCFALPSTIRVGALFEEENKAQELAFKSAIEKMNLKSDILPHSLLIYDVQHIRTHDSFQASRKVCRQIKEGVAAIFGPISMVSAAHVQSICGSLQIPNLHTEWDSRDINERNVFAINIHPYYYTLSRAYLDLIRYWGWKKFAILYEDNNGLVRIQEILKATRESDFEVTIRKLDTTTGNFISVLKDLKNNGEFRILVDCNTTLVRTILKQAMDVNMTTEYFHYLFTTLDIGYSDLKEFIHHGANISSFRLVDPDKPEVMDVLSDWKLEEARTGKSPLMGHAFITTETALMYDAVLVFARSIQELAKAQYIDTDELSCSKQSSWKYGTSLVNYMRSLEIEGLTGRIQYDSHGLRSDFDLSIIELSKFRLDKIGVWNPRAGINITKNEIMRRKEIAESLANHTLTVVTLLESPYAMLKSNPSSPQAKYQGFAIDLLNHIASILKFNYSVYIVKDGTYGAQNDKNKEWNGLVRELIEKNADLAVGGMSITYRREQVIDFTKPFLNVGITILFKRPEKQPPKLFAFLAPLSVEVWVYVVAAYLCVSFMLFVLARFSPYEWYNPHPCNPDSDVVENQFTILNSLWFTIGSLMQQGCEFAPRAVSTRLVSGIWWFFTLIMISSYTANLAAFLTVERMISPIENADDLAKQSEIKYGTLYGGSTMTFYKTSKIPTYQRMWHVMESSEPSVIVNSSQEGIERVLKGNYAYLGESAIIDYVVQRNCELMQVGGLLDSKGYGIATPRESPYRDLISNAILKLQEEQVIHMLYNKWWREEAGAMKCEVQDTSRKDASELGVSTVGGVFVVLFGGIAVGIMAVLFEFVWKAKKNAKEDKRPICSEMLREFRFAMQCFGASKKSIKKSRKKSITDNGIHFMPLGGFHSGQDKEAYG